MVWFQVINFIHLTYRVFLSRILQTVYLIYTQQGEKPSSIFVRWSVRLPENLRGYFSSFCFVLDFVAFFLNIFGKVFNGWKATCMFICDTFLHTIWKRTIFLSILIDKNKEWKLHSSSDSSASFTTVWYDILYSQLLLVSLIDFSQIYLILAISWLWNQAIQDGGIRGETFPNNTFLLKVTISPI